MAAETARVEFYEDVGNGWRWRVKARNGEIVAQGEAHTNEADAVRAFLGAVGNLNDARDELVYG
jgi:uncharacterized protein YegP (UPF0339 family)